MSRLPVAPLVPPLPPLEAAKEDHRVRVARERRERMRAHLLQSVMAVCGGRKLTGQR
jgi:hypothetical protein